MASTRTWVAVIGAVLALPAVPAEAPTEGYFADIDGVFQGVFFVPPQVVQDGLPDGFVVGGYDATVDIILGALPGPLGSVSQDLHHEAEELADVTLDDAGPAAVGMLATHAREVRGPGFRSADVRIFSLYTGVVPPPEYANPEVQTYFVNWVVTPDPALGALLDAWNLGGQSEVTVNQGGPLSPALSQAQVEARRGASAFRMDLNQPPHPIQFAPECPPEFDPDSLSFIHCPPQTARTFNVKGGRVVGMVDCAADYYSGTLGEAFGPMLAYGEGTYESEGGYWMFEDYPQGPLPYALQSYPSGDSDLIATDHCWSAPLPS